MGLTAIHMDRLIKNSGPAVSPIDQVNKLVHSQLHRLRSTFICELSARDNQQNELGGVRYFSKRFCHFGCPEPTLEPTSERPAAGGASSPGDAWWIIVYHMDMRLLALVKH
eukprot:4789081-Pleurochrysis_carterae.AAC.4